MKVSDSGSKSTVSPARARDAPPPAQISLSSSHSRRLRSSGSIKGTQASPMFASGGKKRAGGGGGFENPEPTSPKVTCIGQVRVKTRKHGKKLRTRSTRNGEMSFRKLELSRSGHHSFAPPLNGNPECLPHRNQRWVHFPVTICGALRTFGADWNCLLSCRSSCVSSKEEKDAAVAARSGGEVVARWLVAVQEGKMGGRREIELVVGGEEISTESNYERSRSKRRHVFEGIEFNEEEICRERKEEEQGRVSICVPPKNALLLMRCRSDPVRVAALVNRFSESPVQEDKDEEDKRSQKMVEQAEIEQEIEDSKEEVQEEDRGIITVLPEESVSKPEEKEETADKSSDSGIEPPPPAQENEDNGGEEDQDEAGEAKSELLGENNNDGVDNDDEFASTKPELKSDGKEAGQSEAETIVAEKRKPEVENSEPEVEGFGSAVESKGRDSVDREPTRLPDCLLLMMCEPKLSMEVSKETWVCSTDFIRWLPERQRQVRKATATMDDDPKKRGPDSKKSGSALTAQQAHILQQPPRSSCSFPSHAAAMAAEVVARRGVEPMADSTGQKLVNDKMVEPDPLVLTRCKSEPRRTGMKLAPDACFWKNRKLEPHRASASLGVKAAAVGF